MSRVVIVQRRLTHYRTQLFELLKSELAGRGIHLILIVGNGTLSEVQKKDSGTIEWANSIKTKYFFGGRVCWQPIYRHITNADLVVVTQENKLLANYLLLLLPRKFKLAFWGHGANLQSKSPNSYKERFKRWTTNQVDWWFTYTSISSDIIEASGFPPNRISVLNNSVDTTELHKQRASITDDEICSLKRSHGFGNGPIGVYVGSLYDDKRLDFLHDAAVAIRRDIPDFQLLIIGDGPDREKVLQWSSKDSWIKWVGVRFSREKVAFISLAKILLSPGAVGLSVLDSFACGVPILTTDCGNHGPEIAYIENGKNGIITNNTLLAYTSAAVNLMSNPKALNEIKYGCFLSANKYTLENMAYNFAEGIGNALKIG